MLEQSVFEVGMAIEKLKSHESSSIVQIPEELINAECKTIRSEIQKLIHFIRNKEDLPEKWKESIIVPIYKKGDKADCSQIRSKFYLLSCLHSYLHMERKLLWVVDHH
jgi:hypothetical protein